MILAFDTCLDGCSVALIADGGDLLAAAADGEARGQAERLIPMIESVLRRAGATGADISGLAVTVGPGSFTGARIGIAAARGLALAWDCPTLGVTTLELLAAPARRTGPGGSLVACLPARDGMWFMQAIDSRGEAAAAPVLVPVDGLASCLDRPDAILCCPDPGQPPCPIGQARLGPGMSEPPADLLARLALEMPVDRWRAPLSPVYVRPPDARPSAAGRMATGLETKA